MKTPQTILLKISGDYLASDDSIFSKERVDTLAHTICELQKLYKGIYVVVGGGNIARGRELSSFGFKHGAADTIGMVSTLQNAQILKETLDAMGSPAHIMAPFGAPSLKIHAYEPDQAKHWSEGHGDIVIFGGGLGLRGFTTDMAAVSRAYETGIDLVVKVTEVGGLYTCDPAKHADAELIPTCTYEQALEKKYGVMDLEAFVFASNKKIAIKITSLNIKNLTPENILSEENGTLISE
ncbi:MAG: uridylate kinase [Flavobacteriaceae bacterium]|jgi:uridylate kinase